LVTGDKEHQEEFAMADASPRTDISTDADTDDKNPQVKFLFTFYAIFSLVLNLLNSSSRIQLFHFFPLK